MRYILDGDAILDTENENALAYDDIRGRAGELVLELMNDFDYAKKLTPKVIGEAVQAEREQCCRDVCPDYCGEGIEVVYRPKMHTAKFWHPHKRPQPGLEFTNCRASAIRERAAGEKE